ncbi:hypothetical protein HUJ04_006970 [Dendroctonus ponderosae]|nr:hypothetical protein HUJ04_006970 [Dendroctonus ponderosae]
MEMAIIAMSSSFPYLKKLLQENPEVGQRYLMKLTLIQNLDPFGLAMSDLNYSVNGIPPVTYPDIFPCCVNA